MGSSTDFDFLCRDRRVHHRKLATRLAGVNDWCEFDGTSSTRSIMAGFGNVEDNMLEDPMAVSGSRTARFRRDAPTVANLVAGSAFSDRNRRAGGRCLRRRRGESFAHESWQETPIKLRFIWDNDAGNGPRWEQAFSTDDGRYWETNWTMDFTRR